MACNCGANRLGGTKKYNHVDANGKVLKTYSSEMDARMAASRTPGTRVKVA
jgi:hypothetical protein